VLVNNTTSYYGYQSQVRGAFYSYSTADDRGIVIFPNQGTPNIQGLIPSSGNANNIALQGSGGNVGIGTTDTQGYKLGISTNTLGINFKASYSTGNPLTIARTTFIGTEVCETQIRAYNPTNGVDADLGFLVMNNSSVLNEIIRIKGSTSRVGILTDAPSHTLDVSGRIRAFTGSSGVSPRTDLGGTIIAEGTTRAGLYILTQGTAAGSYGSIWFGNGNTNTDGSITVQNDTRSMDFGTADGLRMRITASGRVLIGTPPPAESTFTLDVNGTGRFSGDLVASSNIYSGGSTSLVTSTGVLAQSEVVQIFNGGAASTNIDKISDLILANNSSFTDGTIGRVIGVNNNLTSADKRVAQIAFGLDGSTNSGAVTFATMSAGTFATRLTIASTGAATFSSLLTAGTAASPSGSKILWGNYSNGALTTFGSSFSSGGPVIGYGVSPSTSAEFAFVSSTGITLTRGAYNIAGGVHYWYAGASQTAAVDSAVTMVNTMSLNASGALTVAGDITLSAANPFVYGGTAAGSVGLSNIGGQTYVRVFGASHATTPNITQFVNAGSTSLTISNTGNLSLKAAATGSAATHVPIFIADPASTTQSLLTRTLQDFKFDVGSFIAKGVRSNAGDFTRTLDSVNDYSLWQDNFNWLASYNQSKVIIEAQTTGNINSSNTADKQLTIGWGISSDTDFNGETYCTVNVPLGTGAVDYNVIINGTITITSNSELKMVIRVEIASGNVIQQNVMRMANITAAGAMLNAAKNIAFTGKMNVTGTHTWSQRQTYLRLN
jgi:hypothetical protein